MKRKVVRHGSNTLTISLPSKWCKSFGVKAGEELDVEDQGNKLIISDISPKQKSSAISVDISNLDRTSTLVLIQGLYRYGYDDIKIRTENTTFPHFRLGKEAAVSEVVHEVVQRFIGSEIISSSSNSFEIKRISQESNDEFETVLRRVFRLLNEMVEIFIQGLEKNDDKLLSSIELHHINIKKFINYSLRLLNKFSHPEVNETTFYFSIIQYISKIDDFIKNAARYTLKNNFRMSLNSSKLVNDIKKSITLYYELFYDYNLKKVSDLNEWREKVRNNFFSKIKDLSKGELVILGGLMQIIEILLDMTELRMAMEN
jgi:phosphate uptake regulator